MPASQLRGREANTLWRVGAFSHQRVAANAPYWYHNLSRKPAGVVVFQYAIEGGIHYRDAAGEHESGPGTAMLCTYGEDSAYGLTDQCRGPYLCDWINLVGAGLPEHWAALRRRHGSVIAFGDDVRDGLRRLMALADPRAAHEATLMATAVHGFVMLLYSSLKRRLTATQSPVERAIDAILANPTHPWSLKEVAERHQCSREHLTRAFTRRLGSAPGAWLAQARVQKALQLLRDTDLPMTAVAAQSGFSSTHTLARRVRRAAGHSPRALRQG